MKRFENQVVLITGAGVGLGDAQARKFASEGASVAINYRSHKEEAQALSESLASEYGGRHCIYASDISKENEVFLMLEKIMSDYGRLDVLVNNAGISINASTWKYPEEYWRKVIDINLTGAFHCIKAALPYMIERQYGRIVNISSVVGITGAAGTVAYSSSKAGIIGMTKTVARETASRNITVNCVAPGYINAGIIRDVPDKYMDKSVLPSIPMGRLGEPEDVANAVLFLASKEAKYITGEILRVDGGFAMGGNTV